VKESAYFILVPTLLVLSVITNRYLCLELAGLVVEIKIRDWIFDSAARRFPITKDGLCSTVESLIISLPLSERRQLPFTKPGRHWYKGFLKRNPRVSEKYAEVLTEARAAVTEQKLRNWFSFTTQLVEKDSFQNALKDPNRVFNIDETAIWLTPKGQRYLGKKNEALSAIRKHGDRDCVTVCLNVCANGTFAPPLFLYKYVRLPKQYLTRPDPDWGIKSNESGWMTCDMFFIYIKDIFIPWLRKNGIFDEVIIFLDGHVSHLSLQLSVLCRKEKIMLVCLSPSATHILQPLDVAVMKSLKSHWKNALVKFQLDTKRELEKHELSTLLKTVMDTNKDALESAIRKGFCCTGLYPFNADAPNYKKCKTNCSPEATVPPSSSPATVLRSVESIIGEKIVQKFKDRWNANPTTCSHGKNDDELTLYDLWVRLFTSEEGDREVEKIGDIFASGDHDSSEDRASVTTSGL